jgi:PhnB protein
MRVEPYLFFPGNCEEALRFYEAVFGAKVTFAMRYRDAPPGDHPSPPELADKIMHATLRSGGLHLMASDSMRLRPGVEAERVALSVAPKTAEEGERIFAALAEGGTIVAAYEKQFWGATFGMLTDRFGIDWMVNAG